MLSQVYCYFGCFARGYFMEKRKSISFVLLLSAAILIAAAGIAVDLVTLQASNARLLDAHRLHLEDLAKSVDQNTDNIFQQMRGQTSYSIRYYPDDLGSSPIGMEPLVSDVIVLEGDTVAEYIFGKVCGLRMLENAHCGSGGRYPGCSYPQL